MYSSSPTVRTWKADERFSPSFPPRNRIYKGRLALDSLGPFAPGVAGGFGVPSPLFVGFLDNWGAEMGGGAPAFGGAPLGWDPPGALVCCFAAALAARCFSCSSLRSAFVMFFCDFAWGWDDEPSADGPLGWVGRTGAGMVTRVWRASESPSVRI